LSLQPVGLIASAVDEAEFKEDKFVQKIIVETVLQHGIKYSG